MRALRALRPYLWTLGLTWVLPAAAVLVLHVTLPDHNASGQCEGLGFGCTPPPSDTVIFLGLLAAPYFLAGGLVVCLLVAAVRARRRRRHDGGESGGCAHPGS